MYLKILFLGVVSFTLLMLFILLAPFNMLDMQHSIIKNLLGGLFIFGFLSALATVYETFLDEGFVSGLISFFSLTIPLLGSYFLFSFLAKAIRKENELNRKKI